MCCVDTIKDNIVALQLESVIHRRAMDRAIDAYLDMILSIQKDIRRLNTSIAGLYKLLQENFSQLDQEDYSQIADIYKKLIKNLIGLYNIYRNSNFYAGIKTDLKNLRSGIDDLQEMRNDLEVFIVKLPRNADFRNIVDIINSL